ncbi:MAG: hypothetical protein U1E81_20245 [Xanthobacteraceae bacterium]
MTTKHSQNATATDTDATELTAHQELFALMLEVGEAAKRLEGLQSKLTERLLAMAERQGIEPDQVVFAA